MATTDSDSTFRYTSYLLIGLLVLFFIGIVTIVILTMIQKETGLPETIDVVLYRGLGAHAEKRLTSQVRAVKKYMCFVRYIYVVDAALDAASEPQKSDTTLGVYRFPLSDIGITLDQTKPPSPAEVLFKLHKLEFTSTQKVIADHVLFLNDNIIPMKEVKKTYLFAYEHPRVFNALRSASIEQAFAPFLQSDIPLTAVIPKSFLASIDTDPTLTLVDEKMAVLLMRMTTEKLAVRRPGMSRDILMGTFSGQENNFDVQTDRLKDHTPLFATFHVNESLSDSVKATKNQSINGFLEIKFPE